MLSAFYTGVQLTRPIHSPSYSLTALDTHAVDEDRLLRQWEQRGQSRRDNCNNRPVADGRTPEGRMLRRWGATHRKTRGLVKEAALAGTKHQVVASRGANCGA